MKRILIILIVGIIAYSLGWWTNEMSKFVKIEIADNQRIDSLKTRGDLKILQVKNSKKKTIHDYISDDKFIHWAPHHSDTTNYMCEISLHEITVLYWYHGQCGYDYFTYITSDTTIDILWSYRTDCILNMDFLEKSNGIKKYPKLGDTFATFTLINDSTLKVKYNYLDWTKKVNRIAKDSLYPIFYYLKI
jgi:hypothetical protein